MKILKITYNGIPIRLSVDLSTKTLQARREWQDILKVMKGKNLQPKVFTLLSKDFALSDSVEKSKTLQISKSSKNSAPISQLYNKCQRNFSRQETQEKKNDLQKHTHQ